jgi:hypothetical protein
MTELKRRILEDLVQKITKAKYNEVAPLLLKAKGSLVVVFCFFSH